MTPAHEVIILPYDPQYASDYKRLNIEWIEKYFVVEEHDVEQLENPYEYIISKGGFIFFAKYNDEVAGTCALIKTGEQEYELAKMAVAENARGKQIGKRIGLVVMEQAKAAGAKRVWLESNRILTTALSLYTKLGFTEIPITSTPYARADIRMEIWL